MKYKLTVKRNNKIHKVVSEGIDLYEAIDKLLDSSDIEIYDTKSGVILYDSKEGYYDGNPAFK